MLSTAGFILIGISFPITIALVLKALSPGGLSPVFPPAIGGPPLLLGYFACHYASTRFAKAKALELEAKVCVV